MRSLPWEWRERKTTRVEVSDCLELRGRGKRRTTVSTRTCVKFSPWDGGREMQGGRRAVRTSASTETFV